jgi:hypothetical protein
VGSRRAPRYPLLVLARPLMQHAVAAMLAVVALGGCGDSGAPPQSLPPLTQSPTTTASTPRATTTPTSTADDLQQSAEHFVRAYVQALLRANSAADPSLLVRDYYDPGCRSCQFDVRTLNELKRKGHHVEGHGVILRSVDAGQLLGNTIAVTVVLQNEPGRVVDESGRTVRRLAASGPFKIDIVVVRRSPGWRILEIMPLGEVK